jgi:outer membrane protein assembly factor BamA
MLMLLLVNTEIFMMRTRKPDKPQRTLRITKETGVALSSFVVLRVLCGYWLFAVLSLAFAQTPRKLAPKDLPPSAFKLVSIKVTGTKRYKPEDIIAATGLELQQTVSEDDFKKAARSLGVTGAFSDVLYSFQYSPEGTKLELQVQDAERFVPVRFDNLVWFSDQELLAQVHAQVPLFQGQLPITGDLADQVSNALQALLIGRNVQGRADYLRSAQEDGPIEAFVFLVTGPQIHIGKIAFSGAGAAELPLLEAAARRLEGTDFVRSILRVQEDKSFLPVYLQHGYLKAALGDPQTKVVQDSPEETIVDVTFPVDPGHQYKLSSLDLAGNKSFPTGTLRPMIHAEMDQAANSAQIETDIEALKKFYGTHGYMAASIQPTPEMDEASSTVKYVLQIDEGDVYGMGDLEIKGLDTHTTDRLQNEWALRGGDRYDSSYAKHFLEQADKEISLLAEWTVSIRESLNRDEKTVDVTLRFDPKPR